MYPSILHYARSLRVSRLVGAGLAASLAVAVGAMGCDQATPLCRTGTGSYTVKYTLTSGAADSKCGKLDTDLLYVNSYNAIGDDGKPDLEKVSAAMAPAALGQLVDDATAALSLPDNTDPDPDATHKYYAYGAFATAEPVGDFCDIPNPSPAIQALPELPAVPAQPADDGGTADKCDDTPAQPAQDAIPATTVSYEFTNWHLLFTAAHAGNQFSVHLKYTVDGDSCEYDGRAALFGQRQSCDKGDGTPLPEACDSVAHPDIKTVAANCDPATGEVPVGQPAFVDDSGLATGSGVDPGFAVTCDPSLVCVLANPVPSLK